MNGVYIYTYICIYTVVANPSHMHRFSPLPFFTTAVFGLAVQVPRTPVSTFPIPNLALTFSST